MKTILPFVALVACASASCVTSETTMIGKAHPPRELNCEVMVSPDVPSFPVENIATSEAQCGAPRSRSTCIEELKAEACKVGANIVYGFREGKVKDVHVITATLALAAAPTTGASQDAPAPIAGDACDPPCSPGYQCEANACKALCNPVCSPGYVCANDRTCQPEAQAAQASSAP